LEQEEIALLMEMGNEMVNGVLEGIIHNGGDGENKKPKPDDSYSQKAVWIRRKYQWKEFVGDNQSSHLRTPKLANQALHNAALNGDLREMLISLCCGGDPNKFIRPSSTVPSLTSLSSSYQEGDDSNELFPTSPSPSSNNNNSDNQQSNLSGTTPFHSAVMGGNLLAVHLLVENGGDGGIEDGGGRQAIDIAREYQFAEIETYLALKAELWRDPSDLSVAGEEDGRSSLDQDRDKIGELGSNIRNSSHLMDAQQEESGSSLYDDEEHSLVVNMNEPDDDEEYSQRHQREGGIHREGGRRHSMNPFGETDEEFINNSIPLDHLPRNEQETSTNNTTSNKEEEEQDTSQTSSNHVTFNDQNPQNENQLEEEENQDGESKHVEQIPLEKEDVIQELMDCGEDGDDDDQQDDDVIVQEVVEEEVNKEEEDSQKEEDNQPILVEDTTSSNEDQKDEGNEESTKEEGGT